MGLFGKNNIEGPGVPKNAPQKKDFFLFWEIFARKFGKIINANLLFILFSIPIVTIGPATAAYTYILRNFAREEHSFIWWDFYDAFKSNFKQAFWAGLFDLAVLFFLVYDSLYFVPKFVSGNLSTGEYFILGFSITAFLIYTFVRFHLYTIMVTFRLKLRYIYKNSLIFAILGLKRNFAAVIGCIITVGATYLAVYYSTFINNGYVFMFAISFIALLYILLIPAFLRFIAVFSTYPTIKKYMIDQVQNIKQQQKVPNNTIAPELEDYFYEDQEDDEEDDGEIIFHDEI